MASKSYALSRGGPKRLLLNWGAFWKNLNVSFDGQLLGAFKTKQDLERGQEFTLYDGSKLNVSLGKNRLYVS